jgi:hypothetical protein
MICVFVNISPFLSMPLLPHQKWLSPHVTNGDKVDNNVLKDIHE